MHLPSARVLLRYHERVGAYIQLGGHGDAGEEDPYAVAQREAAEESGLPDLVPLPLGQPPEIAQVALVAVRANEVEPAHHHLDLRYLMGTESPERAVAESPGAPLLWISLDEAPTRSGVANLDELFAAVRVLLEARR